MCIAQKHGLAFKLRKNSWPSEGLLEYPVEEHADPNKLASKKNRFRHANKGILSYCTFQANLPFRIRRPRKTLKVKPTWTLFHRVVCFMSQ